MGFLRRLERQHFAAVRAAASPDRSPLSDFWYQPTGWITSSGVRMSRDAAMTLSAFWSGAQKIAKSIASVPCLLYQRQDDGGKRLIRPNEPGVGRLAVDLGRQPNPAQTAFDFIFMLVLHALTRGLFVARIQDAADRYGQELLPLHPDRVRPGRRPSGTMVYDYTGPDGKSETLLQDDVFAVWGMTVDGVTPMSVIQYGARSIGATLAAEESAASFFSRGMTAQFGITYKDHLEPTTAQTIATTLAGQNAGLNRGHAPIVLGDDPKIVADLGIKPQDAQLLESRRFGIEEIARWLDIPKHMLKADQGTGSYASLEVLSAEFVTYTLLPWAVQIEQSIGRDLILAPEKYFAEFNLDRLMRGNLLDRYRAHQIGIFAGFETRNDARLEEGRNPLPGLDAPLEPMNYREAGDGQTPAAMVARKTLPPAPADPQAQNGRVGRARLLLFAADAASRLVRRERHEVEQLAKKYAKDAQGWARGLDALYDDLTPHIAQALRIPLPAATAYAAEHCAALKQSPQGISLMADWEWTAASRLTELALEDDAGDAGIRVVLAPVATAPVHVDVHAAPAPKVDVHAPVTVAGPTVNVAPTPAPTVHVAAPTTHIESPITVHVPPATPVERVTTIERGGDGLIRETRTRDQPVTSSVPRPTKPKKGG